GEAQPLLGAEVACRGRRGGIGCPCLVLREIGGFVMVPLDLRSPGHRSCAWPRRERAVGRTAVAPSCYPEVNQAEKEPASPTALAARPRQWLLIQAFTSE